MIHKPALGIGWQNELCWASETQEYKHNFRNGQGCDCEGGSRYESQSALIMLVWTERNKGQY